MLSLFLAITYFISFVNSCSIAYPSGGHLYISNVQLLSTTDYPDEVLLTIRRTTDQTGTDSSRLTFSDYGPWCKTMNVNTGTVSDVVTCDDYTKAIRSYATPDTGSKTTSVACNDNCDGKTATCSIIRNGITYTIKDIPYADSSTTCSPSSDKATSLQPISIGGAIFISFTINDISTTYISFKTNMVGIEFDDTTFSYKVYGNVERVGNWGYLIPGGFGSDATPSIYSDVNVISVNIPCCLCYGSALSSYTITTDATAMTQIFTLASIGSDTKVDTVKARGINYGLAFSDTVTIYDLSNGGSNTFEPDLCDIIAQCTKAPCADTTIGCPYNPNARCVDDYCGGCNARWFCGEQDITNYCDSTPPTSLPTCPDPTTTTQEPKTTDRATTTEIKTTEIKTTTTEAATTESKTTESKTTESKTTESKTTEAATTTTEAATSRTESRSTERKTTETTDGETTTDCICTKEYIPYCCDGNKYGNSCIAKCNGFDVDTECFQLKDGTECIATNHALSIFRGPFIIGFGFVFAVFLSI